MSLSGKAALVSGAGGGIGRAISLAFVEAGAAVCCCDIDAASVEETARLIETAGGRAIARRCDVAVEAETEAAAAAAHQALSVGSTSWSAAPLLTIRAARSSKPGSPIGSGCWRST